MIRAAAIVLAALACALAGCGRTPGAAPTGPVTTLSAFAADAGWSIDSADNHAALSWTAGADGAWVLRADCADNGRGSTTLRREVRDDYRAVRRLILTAGNPEGLPMRIRLGLRGTDGSTVETPAQALPPGWHALAFDLDAIADPAWAKVRPAVERLLIRIEPAPRRTTPALFARLDAVGAPVRGAEPARLAALPTGPATAPRRGLAEVVWSVALPLPPPGAAPAPAGFDRAPPAAAVVRPPAGAPFTVRAFVDGIDPGPDGPVARYRLRLRPDAPGVWWYQIAIGEGAAQRALPPAALVCQPDPAAGAALAPVRVDARDPRWFADADGRFVYPIGPNLGWSGDYRPYLDALAAAGCTWVRTWLAPWNHPLERNGRFDGVDAASAAAIDRLLALAEERGIRVQLVLFYHGMLGADWHRCPWNRANGGPCADPREFWRLPAARALFQRYLDECVARWGHSPALFAWDLVNEADLCPSFDHADIADWHRAMARHLAAADPYRHPVTTSTARPDALPGLWEVAELSFIQVHAYDADVLGALARIEALHASPRRPVQLGEYGRGWRAADEQADPEGRLLQAGQWLGWMHGLAAAPAPWWWDTHLEPNRLWDRFTGLARFAAGEDRRGIHATALRPAAGPDGIVACALVAADRAWLYAVDARWFRQPREQRPPLAAGLRLRLVGLAAGIWETTWWRCADGAVIDGGTIAVAADGALELAPPATVLGHDVAAKLRRRDAAAPALQVSPGAADQPR